MRRITTRYDNLFETLSDRQAAVTADGLPHPEHHHHTPVLRSAVRKFMSVLLYSPQRRMPKNCGAPAKPAKSTLAVQIDWFASEAVGE
jgi:hypothetical protein